MYLFTVCTHNDGWYDALVVSAKRGGYIMKTLGWQCKWGGFVWRLGLMMDAMSNLREDDIVCFTDAYDVIMLVSAPELESRYRLLVDNGGVLISVDNPTREVVVDPIMRAIFGNCVGDKVVNAGAYMGTVAGMRTFLHPGLGAYFPSVSGLPNPVSTSCKKWHTIGGKVMTKRS